jgi:hypothetical protein
MTSALARGGVAPRDVVYANAHGTGTTQNDLIEARALARVFGEGTLLVSSTKSMIGHAMAAAGSLEAVATVLDAAVSARVPVAPLGTMLKFSSKPPGIGLGSNPEAPNARPARSNPAPSNGCS